MRPWTPNEERFLRDHAGKMTASAIGAVLDRSRQAVHAKAKSLGVNLTQRGEYHWKARLNEVRVQMICALKDSGYTAAQIKEAFNLDAHIHTINDAAAGRTWRGDGQV